LQAHGVRKKVLDKKESQIEKKLKQLDIELSQIINEHPYSVNK